MTATASHTVVPFDPATASDREVDAVGRLQQLLAQERIPVLPDDTPESLHERIKAIEHRLLPRVVEELCAR